MKVSIEEVQRIAQQQARYYLKHLPWAKVHAADLMQEAALAVLEASSSNRFDVSRVKTKTLDKGLRVYLERAASQALRNFLWRNRSSLSSRRGCRADNFKPEQPVEAIADSLAASALPIDLDEQKARLKVRSLVREHGGFLAEEFLLDERHRNDVAQTYDTTPYRVTMVGRRDVPRRLRRDPRAQQLYAELSA